MFLLGIVLFYFSGVRCVIQRVTVSVSDKKIIANRSIPRKHLSSTKQKNTKETRHKKEREGERAQ
jgi:hypothetical protein